MAAEEKGKYIRRIGTRLKSLELFLVIILSGVLLGGCSDNEMYDRYFTGTGEFSSGGIPFWFNAVRGAYEYLREWLIVLLFISVAVGVFILKAFSKRNKTLRKTAIFGFILGVPIILICVFFAMAFALNNYY